MLLALAGTYFLRPKNRIITSTTIHIAFIYIPIMKDIKLVREQMVHLVNTIKECNFISYTDKEDIVQTAIEQIYIKFKEGKIVDDFNQIKGYSFITLRNFCSQHRNKKKPIYSDSNFSHIEDDITYDDTEYREELKNIVRSHYYHKNLNSDLIEITEMIFNDITVDEIQEKFDLTNWQFGRKKQQIAMIFKNSIRKNTKYIIKDTNDPYYRIACKSARDVQRHFPTETLRNIREKIYNKKQFKDGRYIETIEKNG